MLQPEQCGFRAFAVTLTLSASLSCFSAILLSSPLSGGGGVTGGAFLLQMGDEERFERWEPIDGLMPKMFLDAMYDDREGFRLILKSPEPKTRALRILFDAPLCYRGAQEVYLLRQIYEAHDDIYPWPIFIVRNSRYARWFYAQAAGAIDKDGHHYHIAAMDEIVDVLSARPPILSWLNDV